MDARPDIPDPDAPDPDAYVKSPCVRVCRVDPASRLCVGCWRSLDEIAGWGAMTPEQRQAVLAALPGRRRNRVSFLGR